MVCRDPIDGIRHHLHVAMKNSGLDVLLYSSLQPLSTTSPLMLFIAGQSADKQDKQCQ